MLKRKRALLDPNYVSLIEVQNVDAAAITTKMKDVRTIPRFVNPYVPEINEFDCSATNQRAIETAFTDLSEMEEQESEAPAKKRAVTASSKPKTKLRDSVTWHFIQPRTGEDGVVYVPRSTEVKETECISKPEKELKIKSRIVKAFHERNWIIPSKPNRTKFINTNPYTVENRITRPPVDTIEGETKVNKEKRRNRKPAIIQYRFYDNPTAQDEWKVSHSRSQVALLQ